MPSWPEWWTWPIEIAPHVLDRMLDRGFNETDLRTMIQDAKGLTEDPVPGRWRVDTALLGRSWRVIVEPDPAGRVLVVVTAYRRE